jgi:hypothetical protein
MGKPKSKVLGTMSTNHRTVYQKWLLLVDTMWQGKVSKTVTLSGLRSSTHFQMRARLNTQ